MIPYVRNPEDLKQAIREHSIAGYPLQLPRPFDTGIGISTVTIPKLVSVIAEIVPPIPFGKLADARGWDSSPYGYEYWVNFTAQHHYPHSLDNPLKWMHPKSQAILEDRYTLSMRDIQARWLKEQGFMGEDNLIRKFSFDQSSVYMSPNELRPGMIVEFHDNKPSRNQTAGRVLALETDSQDNTPIVILESFEPVPALLSPKAIAPWMMDPSYVPDKTWALGYGTYKAMQAKRKKIPLGMFDKDDPKKRVYFLDQPMALSEVQKFCEKYYPKNPECVWQSMVFLVLPIHPHPDTKDKPRHRGGSFRPFPDDYETTEIEASIDHFTEGMEFEE